MSLSEIKKIIHGPLRALGRGKKVRAQKCLFSFLFLPERLTKAAACLIGVMAGQRGAELEKGRGL